MLHTFISTGIDKIPQSVQTLNMAQNGISSIDDISKLTGLINLNLSHNKLTDAMKLAFAKI